MIYVSNGLLRSLLYQHTFFIERRFLFLVPHKLLSYSFFFTSFAMMLGSFLWLGPRRLLARQRIFLSHLQTSFTFLLWKIISILFNILAVAVLTFLLLRWSLLDNFVLEMRRQVLFRIRFWPIFVQKNDVLNSLVLELLLFASWSPTFLAVIMAGGIFSTFSCVCHVEAVVSSFHQLLLVGWITCKLGTVIVLESDHRTLKQRRLLLRVQAALGEGVLV